MPDIGSYFEGLTSRAKGGRRLGTSARRKSSAGEATTGAVSGSRRSGSSASSGGSIFDKFRDVARETRERVQGGTRRPSARGRGHSGVAVTIEYSPALDGDPDPGEVVWTWVPFEEDPSQGKDRPVVIIGRRGKNLVGIPLSTKRDNREAQVEVGTGAWDSERRTSYARIWRLLEIDETRMRREGAILDRTRFDAIIGAVDDYYEVIHAARGS